MLIQSCHTNAPNYLDPVQIHKKIFQNDEKGGYQLNLSSLTKFRAVPVRGRGRGRDRERYVGAWQDEHQSQ